MLNNLFLKDSEKWGKSFTTSLSNLSAAYEMNNQKDLSIMFQEQELILLKKMQEVNPNFWNEEYLSALRFIAKTYANSIDKRYTSKHLYKKITKQEIDFLKFKNNVEKKTIECIKLIVKKLTNLVLYYYMSNQSNSCFNAFKELKQLLKMYYLNFNIDNSVENLDNRLGLDYFFNFGDFFSI